MEQVIQLEKVNKWFDDFHVLKDIDLTVTKGQKIVVCGPSGSGKSTMIRCINRLEAHQKGHIVVHGTELTNDLKNIDIIRKNVGMVFQQFNLFPHLSVIDNISLAPIWVKKMPKKSHPMDVARTAVSIMGLEDKDTTDSSPEANMRKAIRILAKTPTALAAFYRLRKGKKIIKPKKNLNIAENFFYMCFGKVPQKEIVKAFDVSLILYAEHSFNVSTFTARTITSSLSDIHGAITGAIASLKGPLHGGANEEVMHMMNKIKTPNNALKWINSALDNKEVVMGFGHRVYKSGDSRVPTMRKYFAKVAKIKKDKKFEKIYDIVERVMIDRKNIHPNVDYPTGPTYHLMGFDTDFFTPIFVISRITGWSAHIMEQHAANKLIRPLASYKGNQHRKVVQLNQR